MNNSTKEPPTAAVAPKAPETPQSQFPLRNEKKNNVFLRGTCFAWCSLNCGEGQALCSAKPPPASPFLFGVQGFERYPLTPLSSFCMVHLHTTKSTIHFRVWCFLLNCGDRIWTCDLRVMSPTSYRTALLRGSIKNGRRRIRTFEAIATDLQSAPFGRSGIHPYNGKWWNGFFFPSERKK